jgi:Ca2+-binding EF-hand superfamily protein
MRETLSYIAFRDAGVAAPRTTYAVLYLTVDGVFDRQCLGVYTVTEQISKEFLKERFGTSKGLLLKPEGVRDLPYLGDEWIAYRDRYRPHTAETPFTTKRAMDLLKLIHEADDATFRSQIASYLDVDNFLRFLAVNALLCNYDSFLIGGHNFYLYIHPNGRAYLMPWDMHLSLGSFGPLSPDQQPEASISHPHVGEHAMIDRVLAVGTYNQIYRDHLRRLIATGYAPAKLDAYIDRIQGALDEADRIIKQSSGSAPETLPTPRFVRSTPPLKEFVTRRVESVAAQLAGKAEGFVPNFGRGRNVAPRPLNAVSLAGDLRGWAGAGKDGRLSKEKVLAGVERLFRQMDKTKRGWVLETNIAEALSPFLPAGEPQRQQRGGFLAAFLGRPQSPAFVLSRTIMSAADADKNGRLTLEEFTAAVKTAFDESDKNGDGSVDEAELVQALAKRLPAPFNAVPVPGSAKVAAPLPPAPRRGDGVIRRPAPAVPERRP